MRDISLEVMRQEAEAEVRKKRRVVLDEVCGHCFELSLLPAWTPRLLQRLNYSAESSWLEALVEGGFCFKKAARRVWRQATRAAPEYAVFEVTEQWRTWVLDMVVHDDHHQLFKLRDQMSALATAIQSLVAEDPRAVPEATRYWALLAWQTTVEGFQQTLQAHVDDALADNQNHRAMAFLTCARRLLPYLEPRAALVVEGAARRLEVTRRRQVDADKLRHYLVRETQIDAFYAVLDDPETWALHYLGMGGMGKTMLLRYLLSERRPGREYIAARIDFDFLDPDYPTRSPGLLLEALGEELRVQDTEGQTGSLFTTLSNEILGFHEAVQLDEAEGRHVSLAEHPRFDHVLSLFADMIRHSGKPIVFLLDTCEELVGTRVDGNRTRAVTDTFTIFKALRAKRVDFTLVFAGRRLLAKAGSGWAIHPDQAPALPARPCLRLFVLQPFSEIEADRYFQSRGVAETRRDDLLRLCRTDVSLSLDGITDENAGAYYSPFDCALYCDWLAQEPDLDLSGAAEGEDRYVSRRVVGRITDNTLTQWLPAMALLGRFDQATFTAFVDPIPEETAQVAWLDCTGLEWVNAEGAFLAVLDGLRGRLLRWFQWERPSALAAAKTKLLKILGEAITANPTGVDPEYVIDAIRLSDQKRLAQWWPALRDRLVKDSLFERLQAIFRRLAVKSDQFGDEVPEPIALDALLLEAREHAWDGAFNWLPFLDQDETGRAFFAYLTQYSAVIDEFSDRLFAATQQPMPSFEELKGAMMVLGLRVAPPAQDDQPVLTPGAARLEGWRRQIGRDKALTAAVFKACEAYLAWRECVVQPKPGHAYLNSLLEVVQNNSEDASLRLYAAFLQIRFKNVGRRRTTLQKALRAFISDFIRTKQVLVAPDLYWSRERDLHPVIRFFLLRYFWQGILNFDDVGSQLYEQHNYRSARFCSFFYFQAAELIAIPSYGLENYPVEPLPLQLQIPRDPLEPAEPRLALLERSVLDLPGQFGASVDRQLATVLDQSETQADSALMQQAIQSVSRRLARRFAPLPDLSDRLKRETLPIKEDLFQKGLDLDWIHRCWLMSFIPDAAHLEESRKVLEIKDRRLGTSCFGLEVALDLEEFNRLAVRFGVNSMPTPDVDWSRVIHTLQRKKPRLHVEVFRLMLRRWLLGLGRKPNMNRFKARLGERRLVLALIDLARTTALRLPDGAMLLYQTALEFLPPFDPAKPTGLHLICFADMWYCRSLPGWDLPEHPVIPAMATLIPLYQFGEPLAPLGSMLAKAQVQLQNSAVTDDEEPDMVLPVNAPNAGVQEPSNETNETLSFSLPDSDGRSLLALNQKVVVIRSIKRPNPNKKSYGFSVAVGEDATDVRVDLQTDNKFHHTLLAALLFGLQGSDMIDAHKSQKSIFSIDLVARDHEVVVISLHLQDPIACLPAWESCYDWFFVDALIAAWLRAYRRVFPYPPIRPKTELVSAMILDGEQPTPMRRSFRNLWQAFALSDETRGIDILHLIGRPMRLGNGEYRIGLGDAGHRLEGDLFAPESIGKSGRSALVVVQMPAEKFNAGHRLECAYGRGFAGVLVAQGFVDAVLFIPPLEFLWFEGLEMLVDALVAARQDNWPNALFHAVVQIRQRILSSSSGFNEEKVELAGQISLTTAFDIEIEPLD